MEVHVLHDGCCYPGAVGQNVGKEQVGMDLVAQTSHLPATVSHRFIGSKAKSNDFNYDEASD